MSVWLWSRWDAFSVYLLSAGMQVTLWGHISQMTPSIREMVFHEAYLHETLPFNLLEEDVKHVVGKYQDEEGCRMTGSLIEAITALHHGTVTVWLSSLLDLLL